ncbi:monogalactosyldiacylglycerol synthase [Deferribacter desulfuricans SSM1]|uniref:Monogalactosyldiacylglycerol synthase n=1 Tax=Deferribacter desulfuricans (strain DSM 14783 / JCM 11476 / NBRC 101012 / SSM1) TaxID=639282 RepID=D3PC86_DEFDS|nr:glycosyltransferase [Deferribacter desulfuricans]BAI80209.1 monogalactosyldiacylglycerol synthase [Deferribacter desulfuricans SSM1]
MTVNKPIGLFYVTAGNGHKIAARALAESFIKNDICYYIIDVLFFTNKLFQWSYSSIYDFIGEHSHLACKTIYKITDRNRDKSKILSIIDKLSLDNVEGFVSFIKENSVEKAVCTHFLPANILSKMKDDGIFHGKIYVTVTDYGLHKMWYDKNIDCYFVANEEVKDELIKLGVRSDKIHITGIPIADKFRKKIDSENLRAKLNIDDSRKTLLLIGSAISEKRIFDIIQEIFISNKYLNLIVIAGRNKNLLGKIKYFESNEYINLQKLGFVNNIEEYLTASDLVITKPGGLTVSEALACGVPMFLIDPIPYQETNNALYLTKNNCAEFSQEDSHLLVKKVLNLLNNDTKLNFMRENINKIKKTYASDEIVKIIKQDGEKNEDR